MYCQIQIKNECYILILGNHNITFWFIVGDLIFGGVLNIVILISIILKSMTISKNKKSESKYARHKRWVLSHIKIDMKFWLF